MSERTDKISGGSTTTAPSNPRGPSAASVTANGRVVVDINRLMTSSKFREVAALAARIVKHAKK